MAGLGVDGGGNGARNGGGSHARFHAPNLASAGIRLRLQNRASVKPACKRVRMMGQRVQLGQEIMLPPILPGDLPLLPPPIDIGMPPAPPAYFDSTALPMLVVVIGFLFLATSAVPKSKRRRRERAVVRLEDS